MNKIRYLLLLYVMSLLFQYCGDSHEETSEKILKPVKYAVVESSEVLQKRAYYGATQSASETKLSFRSNGLIDLLNVKVGQRVRKGQLLAKLDQRDVNLAYDQARADVQNAQAQYEASASNLERVKKLYQTNNASLSDYEKAKSNYANAQSLYEIALKRLDLQKSQINYTKIIAPMDGIISGVFSGINEVVQAGSPILVINREGNEDIEALVRVPERYIDEIKEGEKVDVKVTSIADNFSGTVTEVGYSSVGSGGTYSVVISLDSLKKNSGIRPGMPVEVIFSFGSNKSPILVAPVKAVARGINGDYVFKLQVNETGNYVVLKTSIELGALINEGFEIQSGLSENDIVAIAGLNSLYDNMEVKLLEN